LRRPEKKLNFSTVFSALTTYRKTLIVFKMDEDCKFIIYFSDFVQPPPWNPADSVIIFMFYRDVTKKIILSKSYDINLTEVFALQAPDKATYT
jgi:hypothetical protein